MGGETHLQMQRNIRHSLDEAIHDPQEANDHRQMHIVRVLERARRAPVLCVPDQLYKQTHGQHTKR